MPEKGGKQLLCQFKRLIYPRSIPAGNSSYMIAVYKPCEAIQDSLGNLLVGI